MPVSCRAWYELMVVNIKMTLMFSGRAATSGAVPLNVGRVLSVSPNKFSALMFCVHLLMNLDELMREVSRHRPGCV